MGGKITSNRLLIFSQLDDCKYFFTQESDGVNDLEVYVED
jgi:hypothetical protein